MTIATFVIAIAGHSGAGKSTAIDHLVHHLGDANTLSLDSYRSSSIYPESASWIEEGADPNAFKMPLYDADVRALKNGMSVIHPETGNELRPARYLVLEEHFGRGRAAVSDLIDFVVYIDTPLDVAYIRKLARKTSFLPWEENPIVFIEHLRENLEWYLRVGRRFYLTVHDRVRNDCDLVVDGLLPSEEIAERIAEAIR